MVGNTLELADVICQKEEYEKAKEYLFAGAGTHKDWNILR